MLPQNKYEEIVNEFKRETGKMISSVYSKYGYDVYHPQVTDHITGLLETAIKKVVKYYEG